MDISGFLYKKYNSPVVLCIIVLKQKLDEPSLAGILARTLEREEHLLKSKAALICSFVQMYNVSNVLERSGNIPLRDLVIINEHVDFNKNELTKSVKRRRRFIYKYIESADKVFTLEFSLANLIYKKSITIIEDDKKHDWIKTLYKN